MVNGEMGDAAAEVIGLLDWKRMVFSAYERVRASDDPAEAWCSWRRARDELFERHPQSPLPAARRGNFEGLDYFPYDSAFRTSGRIFAAEPKAYEIATSGGSSYSFKRFAIVTFGLGGRWSDLELYWLEGYGGGLFLPFRDATSGRETYGAGRYLLDTVKGADLGMEGDALVLDFNFAYNPSCSYDPRWVCPLAPPPNRLDSAIKAGEKHRDD